MTENVNKVTAVTEEEKDILKANKAVERKARAEARKAEIEKDWIDNNLYFTWKGKRIPATVSIRKYCGISAIVFTGIDKNAVGVVLPASVDDSTISIKEYVSGTAKNKADLNATLVKKCSGIVTKAIAECCRGLNYYDLLDLVSKQVRKNGTSKVKVYENRKADERLFPESLVKSFIKATKAYFATKIA